MKEFVEYLVKSIVSKPDEVVVTETLAEEVYTYMVKTAQDDMGRVIGKEGRTIRSIRNLAKAKAIRENLRVMIELEDDRRPQAPAAEEATE